MPRPIRNLLVTGGAGFIGVNFIRWLFDQPNAPERIVNVDNLTYAGNPLSLLDLAQRAGPRYVFVKADICDGPRIRNIIETCEIDSIAHFAAESHVDRSIVAPDEFVRTNILGTYTLLQAAREHAGQIQLFHHVSTDEVFGSLGASGFFTEETPYAPNSPYSASKAASDHLVRAYHETYGLPTTLSNCSNNYGPFQFPEKLIPLIVANALAGRPLPIYGDGMNVRDWLYVGDHCAAIRRVLQAGRPGEVYNVGGDNEMPNIEVVRTVCRLLDAMRPDPEGPRERLVRFVADRPGHDRRYAIDARKIAAELGWQPAETFESGIAKTVRWYLDHQDWVARVQSGAYREWIAKNYEAR